jgi:methanogenic corrinoid protein MtbC1
MIRWCAYCQKFMGEKAPFDDYSFTHGQCASCHSQRVHLREDMELRLQAMREFSQKYFLSARDGLTFANPREFVAEGKALGLGPLDLFMGIVQPLLYRIGEAYARGEITIAREHKFTDFAERILFHIQEQLALDVKSSSKGVDVLLLAAEGNQHTLGIRTLKYAVQEHGFSVEALFPGMPNPEAVAAVGSFSPRVVGLSVAVPEQVLAAAQLSQNIREAYGDGVKVVLGGVALRDHELPGKGEFDLVVSNGSLDSLLDFLRVTCGPRIVA